MWAGTESVVDRLFLEGTKIDGYLLSLGLRYKNKIQTHKVFMNEKLYWLLQYIFQNFRCYCPRRLKLN